MAKLQTPLHKACNDFRRYGTFAYGRSMVEARICTVLSHGLCGLEMQMIAKTSPDEGSRRSMANAVMRSFTGTHAFLLNFKAEKMSGLLLEGPRVTYCYLRLADCKACYFHDCKARAVQACYSIPLVCW